MAISRGQMKQQVSKPPSKKPTGVVYLRKGGKASPKSKGSKICPAGKAWAQRTFDTYPSAYAKMDESKNRKEHNYEKRAKGKKKKKKA